ncbi:cytokine-inducible SH2-containing protein isoform X1 [Brachionichthys hirsutus]|uniref:cytokine-inducible SH2-containing protein isoform X1 n=1 Tax=Brachionichthys hirsutus TaxID=412623 RepID=UPI003604D2D8
MILCVACPRAPLPTPPPTEAPRGMRAGTVSPTQCLHSPPLWDPTKDLRAIAKNFCYLENSGTTRTPSQHLEPLNRSERLTPRCLCAGWYWGAVTAAQAHAALQEASEGAFLVRDSSHPLYMLTLSVRTARGPTSIRIQYSSAQFLLDSVPPAQPSLSSFPSVPSLVQFYMGSRRTVEDGKVKQEAPAKPSRQTVQDASVVLKLRRALYKPQGPPSLQHLTRLAINRRAERPGQLPLPGPLLHYLQDYPFKV